MPSREPGERERGGPKERVVGKGLLEERRGHRAARTGWRPAALPFFHPGELRKAQRAEAGVTGWGAGDSLSTRALMHKGGRSWRSAQSFLITVPSVAVAHVRVPRPTPRPKTWLPSPSSVAVRVPREPHLVPASPGPLSEQLVSFLSPSRNNDILRKIPEQQNSGSSY